MTIKQELIMKYSDKILEMIDEQIEDKVSRGDLQGITEAIIMNTINEYKDFILKILNKYEKEANNLTIDADELLRFIRQDIKELGGVK